jgi:hypothetical protein
MEVSTINWLAVVISAVLAWLFGAIWYMSLSKPWLKAARIDPSKMSGSKAPFIVSFILEVLIAIIMSLLIGALTGGETTVSTGLFFGAILWLGFVFPTQATGHRYQGYGWDLTIIDAGHWLGVLLIIGAVVGFFSGAPV